MENFWEDLKKNVTDWSIVASEKAEEFTHTSKLRIDVLQLERKLSRTKNPVMWFGYWKIGILPPIGKILKYTENINWANIAPQKGGIAYEAIPIILII